MTRAGGARLLHVDCDMFFVQVARLEDPEGAGREPLLMVGGNAGSRGVITSASYELRKYGVRSGMPTSRALRLCPRAIVVPVPREACARRSREVRAVLDTFTPVVQAASIDEFYLDLTGTERLYGGETLAATAARIRAAVRARTSITVSVGGGTRRMVAKMATGLAKPNGIHIVPEGGEEEFLLRFNVRDIPGVGPVFARTLERHGVTSVRDALAYDRETLRDWLGQGRGEWLHDRIRGLDPTPVVPIEETRSVSHERTFASDVVDTAVLEKHLLRLVVELAASLRKKKLRARSVRVYVRYSDFSDRQRGVTVAEPIDSDRAIHRVAKQLLRELREQRGGGVRLLGVGASNFRIDAASAQMRLLDTAPPVETEKDRRLARASDAVRARFGRDAIGPGDALANTNS